MATWQDRAGRATALLAADGSDAGARTFQIFNHILNESNADDYISHDFFNVQQAAGGLPPGMTFQDFLVSVAGHVRSELMGSSFGEDIGDADFQAAVLSFDDSIRRHIRFLNGVVHQGAPGEVHLNLWNFILAARSEPTSIYSLYQAYLVDA